MRLIVIDAKYKPIPPPRIAHSDDSRFRLLINISWAAYHFLFILLNKRIHRGVKESSHITVFASRNVTVNCIFSSKCYTVVGGHRGQKTTRFVTVLKADRGLSENANALIIRGGRNNETRGEMLINIAPGIYCIT